MVVRSPFSRLAFPSTGWLLDDTAGLYLCPVSAWPPGHQQPHKHQQDDKTQSESNLSPSWLSLTTHTVPLHKPHNSIDLGPSCDTVVFGRRPKQLHLWIWPQKKNKGIRLEFPSGPLGTMDINVAEKTWNAVKATDSEIDLTSFKRCFSISVCLES